MSFISTVKSELINTSEYLLKLPTGLDYPDKEESIRKLEANLIYPAVPGYVNLPEIRDAVDGKLLFAKNGVSLARNMVWQLDNINGQFKQLPIGSIRSGKTVYQTDFGYPNLYTDDFGGRKVLKDFFGSDKREAIVVKNLIAPWSHYFRKEYFFYLMFIAGKLSRIKDQITAEEFSDSHLAYPLYGTSFESEYLDLLGFNQSQILDSRKFNPNFDRCYIGNNDNWSYPNSADIISLRKLLDAKITQKPIHRKDKLYIARSGRRRLLNEDELVRQLEQIGFTILEDKVRSVKEQYLLYNNATFIMGPHGASFSNVIWSKPGTHLFELFPQRYIYNFFLYLCQVMGLEYSAHVNGPALPTYKYKTVNDDMVVSVRDVMRYVEKAVS